MYQCRTNKPDHQVKDCTFILGIKSIRDQFKILWLRLSKKLLNCAFEKMVLSYVGLCGIDKKSINLFRSVNQLTIIEKRNTKKEATKSC